MALNVNILLKLLKRNERVRYRFVCIIKNVAVSVIVCAGLPMVP